MNSHTQPVPAVVLKAGRHGGLGIVRTLGRMGVPVYVVDRERRNTAAASRYACGSFVLDAEAAPAQASLDFLLRLAERIGEGAVLLPTSDYAAMFVADHAAQLAGAFRFAQVPDGLVRRLCSKREMHFLARQAGIPTPQAAFPASLDEMADFARDAEFPVMLKGIDGRRLEQRAGSRMFLVRGEAQLLSLYRLLEDAAQPNLMAQQFIPGEGGTVWMFNGYFDRRAECVAGFTGIKLRQYPEGTGLTTLGEQRHNAEVERLSLRLAQAIGYHGVLDIDYRFDARDGEYKILDVNPRVGATFRLFGDRQGLDVVRAAYLDLTGQPVATAAACEGRRWQVEDLDAVAVAREWWARKNRLLPLLASAHAADERALFAADDPAPALAALALDARAAVRYVTNVMGRTRTWEEVEA